MNGDFAQHDGSVGAAQVQAQGGLVSGVVEVGGVHHIGARGEVGELGRGDSGESLSGVGGSHSVSRIGAGSVGPAVRLGRVDAGSGGEAALPGVSVSGQPEILHRQLRQIFANRQR